MAPKTTKKGFIVNGMIDSKTETYPDVTMLLQTWKSEILQKHEDLLFNNFSELYQIMRKDGHIKEDVYKRMGFPSDTNYTGKEVDTSNTIHQEGRHRAKILSHKFQKSLRAHKKREMHRCLLRIK